MSSYRLGLFGFLFCLWGSVSAQSKSTVNTPEKPKLVVGIVIDQMRWDYLYRYHEKYAANGFKRMLNEGLSCANTHINYLPSYTAPGHTCVYTGSVPAIHGIAGNDWYSRELNRNYYCAEDSTAVLVGKGTLKGNVSPKNLLVTTITDELRLATNFQSKVVSLALKDRSAVLPGGHTANGAYFFDGSSANFITTSYYMNQLPSWVNAFNEKRLAEKYLTQNWSTVLPLIQYTESTDDDEPYERAFSGETKPVFIHNVSELSKKGLDIIAATPFGNTLTLDFAKAAIEGEQLGAGKQTDFLAISLSSTDIIGHQFAPNSIEVEDAYLRLDKDLGDFFSYLDSRLGKGNYLVFLTADHGAAHAADFNKQHQIPAGSFNIDTATKQLNALLKEKFGDADWIVSHDNMQFYLNPALLSSGKAKRTDVFAACKNFMKGFEAVADLVDLNDLASTTLQGNLKNSITNGANQKRSGDFQIIYQPAWFEGFSKGTTHGTAYAYDTHIPLVWMGWKIKHGEDHSDVHMTDIAPTIAALLHIQEPNGNVGKVIGSAAGK